MKWRPAQLAQVLAAKGLVKGTVLRWREPYGPCGPGAMTVRCLCHQLQWFLSTGRDYKGHWPRVDRAGRLGEALEAFGQCRVKATPHQVANPNALPMHRTVSKFEEHDV